MSASRVIVEAAERAAWLDLLAQAPPATREVLGIEATPQGDGVILSARSVGSFLVNRALGITHDAPSLLAAAEHFRRRAIARFFVHVPDGVDGIGDLAAQAGLARYPRAWLQLLRGDAPVASLETSLVIRDATASDAALAAPIYCAAFDLPSAFAPVVASLVGRPRWHVFVASDGERPVGIGILHVADGVGYLAGGATDPAYRRRGAQGALVAARVRRAFAQGCRWVATETGEDVAGEPQHSFRNLRRCGFGVVGRRENFAPTAMALARAAALGSVRA